MRSIVLGPVVALVTVAALEAANVRLLDVPFVPQSEELCGGAAVSMVMRYWGTSTVHAEDFAALVDRSAGGISIGSLARAVRERGWNAHAFAATQEDAELHLASGRPVIALIEAGARRLHYVVVVLWTNRRVVFHDPAVTPFRSMDADAFQRAWQATGRTTLLVLPGTVERVEAPASSERRDASRGVAARAEGGRLFLDKRYGDAATLAELAVHQDPADTEAWQLLAASRFLAGDAAAALDAWNRRQEPRVDLARVDGLSRTRYDVVASALDVPPRRVLTRDALARAERRVAEIPSVALSRVSYAPRERGTANVDVAVVEHPLAPRSRADLIAAGVYAATMREAKVNVASPSGNGEMWTASARWWSGRPRAGVALALPALARLTGRWQIDGAWERQTYSAPQGAFESERRHAAVSFGDWASGAVRYRVGAALDRWNDGAVHASVVGELERRLLNDGVALTVSSQAAGRFGTAAASARWRSSRDPLRGWHTTVGISAVTSRTPLDLWPAGDTGVVRSTLLRAHPLLDRGSIRTSELRRVLPHASVEYRSRIAEHPMLRVGWAAFIDAASSQVDAGAGLRVKLPATPGVLRADFARAVRNRATAVSLSWQSAW
jgi:hypothetical protein